MVRRERPRRSAIWGSDLPWLDQVKASSRLRKRWSCVLPFAFSISRSCSDVSFNGSAGFRPAFFLAGAVAVSFALPLFCFALGFFISGYLHTSAFFRQP